MSIAPHAGIVDFGTFVPPTPSSDGIQGEVPQPLAGQENHILSATGWVPGGGGSGTVTSVAATAGVGISVTGSPITTSGTLNITNTAPDQTVTLTNGTGISVSGTYPNFTVTNTSPSSGGTVTSVSGTGTVSGLTLSGTVTSSGNLTLGGAITGFATSGANTDITSVTLTTGTITTAPNSSSDIVNKAYADSIVTGVNFHEACDYATAAALPANTYNNGLSGVGATLTANTNGTLTIDGYTLTASDIGYRLLIKSEATQANNGIYTLTQEGTASQPYILTRATDFDSAGTSVNQIDAGDFVYVIYGASLANTSWVQQTPLPITVGTTAIVFIEFAAGGSSYTAGTGLTLSANQFSISNIGTAGTYGSASQVPVFTTNAQGQVTSVTNTSIAIAGSAVSGNISGNAANVTGTVAVANGGTGQTTYTNGQLLIGNTTGNTLAKATLTAGDGVTITNGAGSITVASPLAESTSVFVTGTAQTYTAPANTQWVKVTAVGPGGNGGGANNQRATGGGGGGVAIKWLAMAAGQTLTYTVGTASGTASTVSSGTLSITTISAGSGANGAGTAYAASVTAGAAGGAASGGDVNIAGGRSNSSFGSANTVLTNFSGKGGDCPGFGTGGLAVGCVATAGTVGNGFGAGGGGSHGNNTSALGTGGVIIFEAY